MEAKNPSKRERERISKITRWMDMGEIGVNSWNLRLVKTC